jgi:hypothetical protein
MVCPAVKKRSVTIAALIAGAGLVVAACGGNGADGDAIAVETQPAIVTATPTPGPACTTAAMFTERWPGEIAGGMTIGPVTLTIGDDAHTRGIPLGTPSDQEGVYIGGFLIQIDAPEGEPFEVTGELIEGGARAKFDLGAGWRSAVERLRGTVPPRDTFLGQRPEHPGLVQPGVVFFEPGCYQVWLTVSGEPYGPFGMLVSE